MRIWLARKKPDTTPSNDETNATEGWLQSESAEILLAKSSRQQLIQFIRQSTALPAPLFERFWLTRSIVLRNWRSRFRPRKTITTPMRAVCSITVSKPPAMPHGCGKVIFFRLMQRRKIRPLSPNAGQRLSSTPHYCTIWVNSSRILRWRTPAGNAGFRGMVH